MRLIDADAILHTHKIEQEAIGKDWGVDDLATAIMVAETMDAIPVEWLLKKKASCIRMSSRSSQTAWLIGELIKEWRKEMGGE